MKSKAKHRDINLKHWNLQWIRGRLFGKGPLAQDRQAAHHNEIQRPKQGQADGDGHAVAELVEDVAHFPPLQVRVPLTANDPDGRGGAGTGEEECHHDDVCDRHRRGQRSAPAGLVGK